MRDFRKHIGWYLQGFPVGRSARQRLMAATSRDEVVAELNRLLDTNDGSLTVTDEIRNAPRGHTNGPRPVTLPEHWLDTIDDPAAPAGADAFVSGG